MDEPGEYIKKFFPKIGHIIHTVGSIPMIKEGMGKNCQIPVNYKKYDDDHVKVSWRKIREA